MKPFRANTPASAKSSSIISPSLSFTLPNQSPTRYPNLKIDQPADHLHRSIMNLSTCRERKEGSVFSANLTPVSVDSEHYLNLPLSRCSSSLSIYSNGQEVSSTCSFRPKSSCSSTEPVKAIDISLNKSLLSEEENLLMSPSSRWNSHPRSYRGASRGGSVQRKLIRKIPSCIDTTDGETSGVGSSVDEPVESSTESASETPDPAFLQPRSSSRPPSISPSSIKKRRGGWPKGRKRKPELQGTKPPKAPLTAYVLFLNERRKYYKENYSHLQFIEVSKLMGAEWSSMTGEEKSVYIYRSEQEKKRYKNELQSYRLSSDYQLQLRKKRMKNVNRRGATTTEESSDFTDEIDDDDSEELYCRICDQWFISLHNKREHLYGRLHIKAITGEYQRERKVEEMRQEAASESSSGSDGSRPLLSNFSAADLGEKAHQIPLTSSEISCDAASCDSHYTERTESDGDIKSSTCALKDETEQSLEFVPAQNHNINLHSGGRTISIGTAAREDHDYDDEDEEYDGEEEVTEEEGGVDSDRVSDAAEEVLKRMIGRENEIRWLRRRHEKSRNYHKKLTASVLGLLNRQRQLEEEKSKITEEEKLLKEQINNLSHFTNYWRTSSFMSESSSSTTGTPLSGHVIAVSKGNRGTGTSSLLEKKSDPWRIKDNGVVTTEFLLENINPDTKPFRLKTKYVKLKNSSSLKERGECSVIKMAAQEQCLRINIKEKGDCLRMKGETSGDSITTSNEEKDKCPSITVHGKNYCSRININESDHSSNNNNIYDCSRINISETGDRLRLDNKKKAECSRINSNEDTKSSDMTVLLNASIHHSSSSEPISQEPPQVQKPFEEHLPTIITIRSQNQPDVIEKSEIILNQSTLASVSSSEIDTLQSAPWQDTRSFLSDFEDKYISLRKDVDDFQALSFISHAESAHNAALHQVSSHKDSSRVILQSSLPKAKCQPGSDFLQQQDDSSKPILKCSPCRNEAKHTSVAGSVEAEHTVSEGALCHDASDTIKCHLVESPNSLSAASVTDVISFTPCLIHPSPSSSANEDWLCSTPTVHALDRTFQFPYAECSVSQNSLIVNNERDTGYDAIMPGGLLSDCHFDISGTLSPVASPSDYNYKDDDDGTLNPPLICEETFFSQFGIHFDKFEQTN